MIELNPKLDVNDINTIPVWELGQHGGRTRPIDREVLFKNLCDYVEILDTFKIKYCLSHGTMLGVYRDGDFIAWDDDVDISLLDFRQREFFSNVVEPLLDDIGFYIPKQGDRRKPIKATGADSNMPYYDSVAIRDGEKIEGWWFEKKGDFYVYDESRSGTDLKHSAKYYDELKDFEWKGRMWKVPNHLEDYIVMMYGRSWNVPQPERKYNNQKFDSKGNSITDVS